MNITDEKRCPEHIERARADSALARKRISITLETLQYRLKPANLANQAWNDLKSKGSDIADNAIQAVKDRPVAASSIFAALILFLARNPLWSTISDVALNRKQPIVNKQKYQNTSSVSKSKQRPRKQPARQGENL